jgi:hypothetical protein
MKHFFLLLLSIGCFGFALNGQVTIAEQNFNSLTTAGNTQTFDENPSGSFLTNGAAANGAGTGLDIFQTQWIDTRGVTNGPVTNASDGDGSDFIGVNAFSSGNAPNNGPGGTSVAAGVEQNFQFNDCDGECRLAFGTVNLSGYTARTLELYYWINDDGYESVDEFRVELIGNGNTVAVLTLDEAGLDANVNMDVNNTTWNFLSVDLEPVISGNNLGESLQLRIVVDNNSGGENIFVDDIAFKGTLAPTFSAGDIIITEIMQNPNQVGDSDGEWFEVYNTTGSAIDLNGWTISDDGSDSHTIASSVVVQPNNFVVLGNNADVSTNGGLMIQYQYPSNWFLSNGADEVVLTDPAGNVIDFVDYDGGPNFPDPTGASMSLDPSAFDATSNNDGANWCEATSAYGNGDLGTPRMANDACVTPCVIDNVVITSGPTCIGENSEFDISFDVAGGSGTQYNILNPANSIAYGVQPSTTTDGTVTSTGGASSAASPGMAQLIVVDAGNAGCQSDPITITVPDCSVSTSCSELFISEYVEGSGNNKYIEVYNPTGSPVDLSNYELRLYNNGSSTSQSTNTLSGTLASGDVVVYRNSSATIYSGTSIALNSFGFTGNDAIALYNTATGMFADIFGQIGCDPGSQWNVSGNETQDQTLRRNSGVTGGVTSNPAGACGGTSFITLGTEWTEFAQNDVSGLGMHMADGCATGGTAPQAGDIIITEIMQNPSQVGDGSGEYFEVYNTTHNAIDLQGWTIKDDGSDSHTIASSVVVPAGGYAVLGNNDDTGSNGGVTVDYEYAQPWFLGNSDDEVVLVAPDGTEIDRVNYDDGATFPDPTGASMSLDPDSFDATSNNDGANWCEATSSYGSGDLGTPGAANDDCAVGCVITNVILTSDGACSGDNATFRIDFTVTNGSGNYSVVDMSGYGSTTYGSFDPGIPNGSFFIIGTVSGPTTAGTIMVVVSDGAGCESDPITVTIPDCPPVAANCANVGDIIITEIMQNPTVVSDDFGEYVELYNTTGADIDLQNYVIRDADFDAHTIASSVIVPANGFVVLGRSADMNINGGIPVAYEYDNFFLGNGFDEVVLECNGTVIDIVAYDDGITFPGPNGASMNLSPTAFDAASNDSGLNWCESTVLYDANNAGTPGAANEQCCDIEILSVQTEPFCEETGGSMTINVSCPSCNGIKYSIDGGSTFVSTNTFTGLAADAYDVVVMDAGASGCMDMQEVFILFPSNNIPEPWTSTDVGNQGVGSSYSYDVCDEEFTVIGGGLNPNSLATSDNVAFIHQTVCGNGSITVKLESVSANGYGGITIRETTAPGSKQVTMFSNLQNIIRWEQRQFTNGAKTVQAISRPFPFWLRIERVGNWFFGYYSTTGANNFQIVQAVNISMGPCAEYGMTTYSFNPIQASTAVFSNVSIQGGFNGGFTETPDFGGVEEAESTKFEVFPNPATDIANIRFGTELTGTTTLRVRNELGQVVEQLRLETPATHTELNVSTYASGVYFIELLTEGRQPEVLRFVKTK